MALLPGLDGPWWFEETPWFTPFLREAIAKKVVGQPDSSQAGKPDLQLAGKPDVQVADVLGDHPEEYLDSHTAQVQKWLWEAASRCRRDMAPGQSQLLDRLKAFSDGNR